MKVQVSQKETEANIQKYPCLVRNKHQPDLVLLLLNREKGVCLQVGKSGWKPFQNGEYGDLENWEPFTGYVTLSNE